MTSTADEAAQDSTDADIDVKGVGKKASRGLRWSLLGTVGLKIGSIGVGLAMARLLSPRDFGVYAIALAVTAFLTMINDFGVIAATVQWRGKVDEMAPTATLLALVMSGFVYGCVFVLAPQIAHVAGSPDATSVIRILSATVLVDGVTAVRSGKLMRDFKQDKLMMAIGAGFLVQAPVSISLAANGAGAFSFAFGSLGSSIATGILVLIFAGLPYRVGLDRAVLRRLIAFGAPLALGLGVEAVLMNADYFIVGDVLGPVMLGFYLLAFNISSWAPGIITTAVKYVSIAGFSRLSETDGGLDTGVRRSLPLLVGAIIPIAVLFGVLADSLIGGLYGARWLDSVTVLRFLMILMLGRMVVGFCGEILMGAGATRAVLAINAVWAAALVPALIVGAHLWGIAGAGAAHAIVAVLVALPAAAIGLRRLGVRLHLMLPALGREVVGGAMAGIVAFGVHRWLGDRLPDLADLVIAGAAGFAIYVLTVVPFSVLRNPRSIRGGADALVASDAHSVPSAQRAG